MARIPIEIIKIKTIGEHNRYSNDNGMTNNETVKYLFSLSEKGETWSKTIICDRNELLAFKQKIEKLIDETSTAETLKIDEERAKIVDEHYKSDSFCKNCTYKLTNNCITCLFELQSPLERQLFLEFKKAYINFQVQYGIDWNGNQIDKKTLENSRKSNNFRNILTIPDFYIEKHNRKICIYTDGHTYHERTEEQAIRDRNIDRKLQELDFIVLRYTGKEVRENCSKIISDIQQWINKR